MRAATTHPIQQAVASEAEAGDAFDEITYDKGQAFIRMLESYLGETTFRDGIRIYMQRHQFGSTTTADLWQALAEASGKPVREFAAGWTEQPGFPVVKVRATGAKASLAQERFTLNQKEAKPLQWQIPVLFGPALRPEEARLRVLESSAAIELAIPADTAWKANLGDAGYYRVQYDDELFARLVANAPQLAETDRLNLLNDTWALVQAERMTLESYLTLATRLANDSSTPS